MKYDSAGGVASFQDASGGHNVSYGSGLTVVKDPASSATTAYYFDPTWGAVNGVVDALGNQSQSFFDVYWEPVLQVGPKTNAMQYTYNSNGDVVEEREKDSLPGFTLPPLGQSTLPSLPPASASDRVTTYTYVTNALPATITQPLGQVTQWTYDPQGRLLRTTRAAATPDQAVAACQYDGSGNLVTVTNAATNTMRLTYDAWGRLIGMTNAAGQVTAYGYDLLGNVTNATLPGGVTGSYRYLACAYDLLGRVISSTFYAGGGRTITRSFSYDADGNKTGDISPMGGPTTYTYDDCDRLAAVSLPDGTSTYFACTPEGQLAASTNVLGNVKLYHYDLAGRRTGVEYFTNGWPVSVSAVSNVLDSAGLTIRTMDGEGRSVYSFFDGFAELLASSDDLGHTVSYAYDQNGDLIARTNADGTVARYNYNQRGALIGIGYSTGKTNALIRDVMDRVTRVFDNAGFDYSMAYDPMGRLARVTDNTTNRTYSYYYDQAGNLTNKTSPEGLAALYSYDAMGNLIRVLEGAVMQTNYYDNASRLSWSSNNNALVTSYIYDMDGNVTSQTTMRSGTAYFSQANSYDPLGRLTEADKYIRTISGSYDQTTSRFYYDGMNRLTREERYASSGPLLYTRAFTYDRAGNRTHLSATDGSTMTEIDYAYDAASRLINEVPTTNGLSAMPITYGYDANGNLTSRTQGATLAKYFYDEEERLLAALGPGGSRTNGMSPDGKVLRTEKWLGATRVQNILFEYRREKPGARALAERADGDQHLHRWTQGGGHHHPQQPRGRQPFLCPGSARFGDASGGHHWRGEEQV